MEAQVYSQMASVEDRHWWFVGRRRILAEVIRRLVPLPTQARILEAGCGTGGNLNLLAGYGCVQAFDPSEQARAHAAAKGDFEVRIGSLPNDIPYDEGSFDLVAALDILEHVEADRDSLARLHDQLRPGGSLLLTVPAFPFLWSRHDERHHHKRRYRKHELVEKLATAGFAAIEVRYFNAILFPVVVLVRQINTLLGRDGGSDERLPPPPVNRLLTEVFASERHAIGRLPSFFGVSLLAVARRSPS